MNQSITRRSVLRSLAGGGAAAVALGTTGPLRGAEPAAEATPETKLKGNINHSVCRWCYRRLSLDELCEAAVEIGLKSVELLGPDDWPTLKKYGLTCAITNGAGGIAQGFNRVENHDRLVAGYEKLIPQAADAGMTNVICFSGNRDGLDDEQGAANCVKGLKRLMPLAEQKKINLVMELLNSKVNHKGYQCDRTPWGVEVCKGVGSERMKLLYDIYHMQIMEGDLIATIKKYAPYIAHYHTGGVPGRAEIDETQEIYYPAVMKAIVATGYDGFVGQEFVPRNADVLASLRRCVRICDV